MSKYYVEILNHDGHGQSIFAKTGYLSTDHELATNGAVFISRDGRVYQASDIPEDCSVRTAFDESSNFRSDEEREKIAKLANDSGFRTHSWLVDGKRVIW